MGALMQQPLEGVPSGSPVSDGHSTVRLDVDPSSLV
jgi:hypothetical protein